MTPEERDAAATELMSRVRARLAKKNVIEGRADNIGDTATAGDE